MCCTQSTLSTTPDAGWTSWLWSKNRNCPRYWFAIQGEESLVEEDIIGAEDWLRFKDLAKMAEQLADLLAMEACPFSIECNVF